MEDESSASVHTNMPHIWSVLSYSYIFLDRDFIMRETTKLLVFVLGKLQIPDGFAHICSTLTQMTVHFFQLLLSGQYSLHFLLMEALLFPGNKDNQKGLENRC